MKKILPQNAILIPDNATKVFTGQIFDVYQWPQQLYDGSEATFEMLKRPDTVQILPVVDGKILVIQNGQPGRKVMSSFPGGRADEDTSWLAAAQRELAEETGYKFKTWKLVWVRQAIPKIEWFTPIFVATDVLEHNQPEPDAGEQIEVGFKSIEEVKAMIASDEHPMMNYTAPLFAQLHSIDELIALPEFQGREVDR